MGLKWVDRLHSEIIVSHFVLEIGTLQVSVMLLSASPRMWLGDAARGGVYRRKNARSVRAQAVRVEASVCGGRGFEIRPVLVVKEGRFRSTSSVVRVKSASDARWE